MSPTVVNTLKLLARKLVQLVVVLLAVTIFVFLLVRLLGDPVNLLVPASDQTGDPVVDQVVREQKDQVRADLGLDKPLPEQYLSWLGGLLTGDMGNEYRGSSTRPASDAIGDALPISLQLILYSQVIALVVAIPLGVISAHRQNSIFDRVANAGAFGLLSLPNFAVALVLAYWIGVKSSLPIPAVSNRPPPFLEDPSGHMYKMVLPAVSLALGQIAIYMRLLRSDMIQTLQEDYILMAKAKGISNQRVLWRHALRPSSLTLLTVAGLNVGTLIGGTVVIEYMFNIPGMGQLMAKSIIARQFIVLQSCVAIVAVAFVVINALLDMLYTVLDPRIRNVRAS